MKELSTFSTLRTLNQISCCENQCNLLSSQTPVIPPTISDQIRLWELERSRMKFTEGKIASRRIH